MLEQAAEVAAAVVRDAGAAGVAAPEEVEVELAATARLAARAAVERFDKTDGPTINPKMENGGVESAETLIIKIPNGTTIEYTNPKMDKETGRVVSAEKLIIKKPTETSELLHVKCEGNKMTFSGKKQTITQNRWDYFCRRRQVSTTSYTIHNQYVSQSKWEKIEKLISDLKLLSPHIPSDPLSDRDEVCPISFDMIIRPITVISKNDKGEVFTHKYDFESLYNWVSTLHDTSPANNLPIIGFENSGTNLKWANQTTSSLTHIF